MREKNVQEITLALCFMRNAKEAPFKVLWEILVFTIVRLQQGSNRDADTMIFCTKRVTQKSLAVWKVYLNMIYPSIINIFNISGNFWLDELSQLRAFMGTCINGSNAKQDIKNIDTTNNHSCYEECKITQGCSAFTFQYNKNGTDCDLHGGGPYIKGSGIDNTTCYLMPKGIRFGDISTDTLSKWI